MLTKGPRKKIRTSSGNAEGQLRLEITYHRKTHVFSSKSLEHRKIVANQHKGLTVDIAGRL